ncbi:MAG: TIGR02679 family protein [Planctomycetota bacterium]
MVVDPVRLRKVLGVPAWTWLRARLRKRLAAGRGLPALAVLRAPSEEERRAANALFATPGATGPVRVRLDALTAALQEAGLAVEVRQALEIIDGPIPDRAGDAARDRATWEAIDARARARIPDPHAQLPAIAAAGLWRRMSAGDAQQAAAWVDALAAIVVGCDGLHLGELAARVTGDAHALDRGTPLGRLAVRLLGGDDESWRETWQRAGVVVGETTSTVLTLNLRWAQGPLAGAWNAHAAVREPLVLTARVLAVERAPVPVPVGRLFVCENPTVLEAAARRGCTAPLVCIAGQPGAAALMLLARCNDAELCYHGDFDWAGITIANGLARRFRRFRPWRFTAADLRAADALPGPPLVGEPVAAAWDDDLCTGLRARGRALHEEAVLDVLTKDVR